MKRTVAFIFAMIEEAELFIHKYNFRKVEVDTPYSFEYYEHLEKDFRFIVAVNGKDPVYQVSAIGTVPAALNTEVLIQNFSPNLIISAGTAGGFKEFGANIGDVYLSKDTCFYHDRVIPIPGFDKFGVGSYKTTSTDELAKKLGLKQGNISTGDSLQSFDDQIQRIKDNKAEVKEMEAAAISYVCQNHKVDFMAFKSVTDLLDEEVHAHEQFLENLKLASSKLHESLNLYIEHLLVD